MNQRLMPPLPRELPPDARKFADGTRVIITAGPLKDERGIVVDENRNGNKPMPWLLLVDIGDGRTVWCNDGYLVEDYRR